MAIITMTYNDISINSNKLKTISNSMKELSKRLEKVNKSVKTVTDFEKIANSILAVQDALDDQIDYIAKLRTTLDSISQRYQTAEVNAGKNVEDINDEFELRSVAAAVTFTEVFSQQIIAAAQYIWSTIYPGDTAKQDLQKLAGYLVARDTDALIAYGNSKVEDLNAMGYNVVNSAIQQVSFGAVSLSDLQSIDEQQVAHLKAAVGAYKDNFYKLAYSDDYAYIAQGAKVNNYFEGLLNEAESNK